MKGPVCDSCGKKPTKSGLAGFKLTAEIAGETRALVARLCARGCAEQMRLYRASHKTTEPPEVKTQWGGEELKPLRAGKVD